MTFSLRRRSLCALAILTVATAPVIAMTPGLEPLEKAPPASFDLPWSAGPAGFNLTMKLAKPEGLLVAFNHQNASNYYKIEFGQSSVSLYWVQSGLQRRLDFSRYRGDGKPFLLKRRKSKIELVEGSELRLKYFDRTFQGGKIGFGGADPGSSSTVGVQPIGTIFFSDDFMRGEGDPGQWSEISKETWKVRSIRNPLRSENAFKYSGKAIGKPARTMAGHWFWDEYTFEVAFQSRGKDAVGLHFFHQDDENYLQFRWTSSQHKNSGRAQLVRRLAGRDTILFQENLGYHTGQWYKVAAQVEGDRVRVFVDRSKIGEAVVPGLWGGKVGLFTESVEETLFDDVRVFSNEDFHADFTEFNRGRWKHLGRGWRHSSSGCYAQTSVKTSAVVGDPDWFNYTVEATAAPVAIDSVGLIGYFQDAANYYLFECRPKTGIAEIKRLTDGSANSIAQAPLQIDGWEQTSHSLSFKIDSGILSGFVDGRLIVQAADSVPRGGMAGLHLENGESHFSNFNVRFLHKEQKALGSQHQVFKNEVSMSNWALAESDWIKAPPEKEEAGPSVSWHRVNTPGAVDVRLPLSDFPGKDSEGKPVASEVRLLVAAESDKPNSGYALSLSSHPAPKLRFYRQTEKFELEPGGTKPGSLRLRRDGGLVLCYLNGRQVFALRDPSPLTGDRVGYSTAGANVKPDRIQVFAENVMTDSFQTAPGDWTIAEGRWEVSNRWQCDPRWSFFSGIIGGKDDLVSIWHKRTLDPESLTIELTIGQKMRQDMGTYQNYATDYNLTICADGQDLSSGYSLVFGGWKNKRTAIVRKSRIVAETKNPVINVNGLHRKWYVLKTEKKGKQIRFYIDNILVLSFTDPEPLKGTRFAIWSYGNSIMVPRVRISAPGPVVWAHPAEPVSQRPKSFYDEVLTSRVE